MAANLPLIFSQPPKFPLLPSPKPPRHLLISSTWYHQISKYKEQFQLFYITRTAGNHPWSAKWRWKYFPCFWYATHTFSLPLECPNTPLRPFKPCPKTPLLPRPPSAPRKGCKQWRSQLKGLWDLSTADMKSGAHEHIPGVLFGALLATLLSLTAACLKSKSIFTTPQVKWYPKLPIEANTKLLNHSSDCRPYSFYPFNSGQKHNHQEHGFRSVQSCSPTEHYGSFYWNSDFCLMHFKYLGLCSKF